ncbi:MAG: ATP-grasp domain-containing protein [Promethearchaeota archaeon]
MTRVKLGIIVDQGHLKFKMGEFLKYAKTIAEVSIYVEQELLFNPSELKLNEDVFLVKGKGDLLLDFVRFVERETSAPIINSYKGTYLTIHRFLNSLYLERAGILVPKFSLSPCHFRAPYEDYIIKNIVDKKIYSFTPRVERVNGHVHVIDQRAWDECYNDKERYNYFFYQEFIESEWEYKIYGIGEQLLFYKQVPLLYNPNKLETRHKIEKIPELEEICYKAMEVLDLKLTSIDFLRGKDGEFYLTDINCTPNFNYIKDGPKIVANFLIEQAKR